MSQRSQSRNGSQLTSSRTISLEQALLNAQAPIASNSSEQITVNGQSGIYLNKREADEFSGSCPINKYGFNKDCNPQVIHKRQQPVEYVQKVNVKYLRPQLQQPGPIIIQQEPDRVPESAPAVIIRQEGKRAQTPAPVVVREAPPRLPSSSPITVNVPGKLLPLPPRKVIVERLADEPAKPANVCLTRWLAPAPVQRQVIFKPACPVKAPEPVRNVIVQWCPAKANVRREVNVRGVECANAEQFRAQYGDQLVEAAQLPQDLQVDAPEGQQLAANADLSSLITLTGDVEALSLIEDLDKAGLGEYKSFVAGLQKRPASAASACRPASAAPSNCGC